MRRTFALGAVIILALWSVFWLYFFGMLNLPFLPSRKSNIVPVTKIPTKSNTLPTEATKANLETCGIKKEGNPLVDGEITTLKIQDSDMIVGTFRGNINGLEEVSGTTNLELIAPAGDQTYTFKLKEEEGLVYDAIELQDLTLKDLNRGMTVVLSFNCNIVGGKDNFRITRVAITGKL